jgi:hypothetical protein
MPEQLRERWWQWRHRRCVRILTMRPEDQRDYVVMHPEALDRMCDDCRARMQRDQIERERRGLR